MTTAEIVADWLRAHGYDGLAGEDCGCALDDLMPCGEIHLDCVAGHQVLGCTSDCGRRCDYHIVAGECADGLETIQACDVCGLVDHHCRGGACPACNRRIQEVHDEDARG